jgi:hypothetical protein
MKASKKANPHKGSTLDSFLAKEGVLKQFTRKTVSRKTKEQKALLKLIEKVDLAVERADYGGLRECGTLANIMTDAWPVLEPVLRKAAEAQ